MKKELQPTKVQRLNCHFCGELMAKFYPNHTFNVPVQEFMCKKCLNKRQLGTLKSK